MSGVVSIPADALNDIPHSSCHPTPSTIITESPMPGIRLPAMEIHCGAENDSDDDLCTEDSLWPQLPSKEEPFLLDVTSGAFISNADFLEALLENYDSLSLCQKRILYADVKG